MSSLRNNIDSIHLHGQVWFLCPKQRVVVKLTNVCAINKWNVGYGIQEWEVQVVIVTICEFYCPERLFNGTLSAFEMAIDQKCSGSKAANSKRGANSNYDFLLCWKPWNKVQCGNSS